MVANPGYVCQSGLHPLEHPAIAALSADYESEAPTKRRWPMPSHIDTPQRILTTLGVDIFKDLRYDTWVLQTIWVRLMNNQQGGLGKRAGVLSREIFPLYSCLNHSCDVNAMFWGYLDKPSPAYWKSSLMFDHITICRIGDVVTVINSNPDPDVDFDMEKFLAAILKISAKQEASNNAPGKKDRKSDVPDNRPEKERLLEELKTTHHSTEKLMPGIGLISSDDSDDSKDRKYSECSEISIIATKDIKAGEEIFISYVSSLGPNAGLEERRFMLKMNWLSGDCMCTRCIAEDPATESGSTTTTPTDVLAKGLVNLSISTPDNPQPNEQQEPPHPLTKNQRKNQKKREKVRLTKQAAREQQEEGGPSNGHEDQENSNSTCGQWAN